MIQVVTPPRILIKRAIYAALKKYIENMPLDYRFELKQDYVGEFGAEEWIQSKRLVIVYLDEVENDGSHTVTTETSTFSILCAVSPNNNDDTTGAEGLHLLADQVRCALWGHGQKIGLQLEIPEEIRLTGDSRFTFKIDAENSFRKERLVMFGVVTLTISYIVHEYEDYQFEQGAGILFEQNEGE